MFSQFVNYVNACVVSRLLGRHEHCQIHNSPFGSPSFAGILLFLYARCVVNWSADEFANRAHLFVGGRFFLVQCITCSICLECVSVWCTLLASKFVCMSFARMVNQLGWSCHTDTTIPGGGAGLLCIFTPCMDMEGANPHD